MPDELTEEQRKVIDALNLTGNVASFMGPAVPTMNPILRALIGVGQDVVKDVEQTVPTQYEATSRILEGLNWRLINQLRTMGGVLPMRWSVKTTP